MSLPNETIIHLQWVGPFTLAQALAYTDRRTDYGVYQVCGPHTSYGPDALLYIGQAARQTFGTRLGQESWRGWQETNGSVHVFLGRLHGSETPLNNQWNAQIDWAERLLIFAHRPAHNASRLNRRTAVMQTCHVLNWGDRGRLLPEVSGARFGGRFAHIENYAPFGSHANNVEVRPEAAQDGDSDELPIL